MAKPYWTDGKTCVLVSEVIAFFDLNERNCKISLKNGLTIDFNFDSEAGKQRFYSLMQEYWKN